MCPKLIELLSWNGPTVHVCCFMLARASTKTFVIRIHIRQPSPKNSQKSLLAEKFVSRVTRQPRYHCTTPRILLPQTDMSGQVQAPTALPPPKGFSVPIEYVAWWAPERESTCWRKENFGFQFASEGDRSAILSMSCSQNRLSCVEEVSLIVRGRLLDVITLSSPGLMPCQAMCDMCVTGL